MTRIYIILTIMAIVSVILIGCSYINIESPCVSGINPAIRAEGPSNSPILDTKIIREVTQPDGRIYCEALIQKASGENYIINFTVTSTSIHPTATPIRVYIPIPTKGITAEKPTPKRILMPLPTPTATPERIYIRIPSNEHIQTTPTPRPTKKKHYSTKIDPWVDVTCQTLAANSGKGAIKDGLEVPKGTKITLVDVINHTNSEVVCKGMFKFPGKKIIPKQFKKTREGTTSVTTLAVQHMRCDYLHSLVEGKMKEYKSNPLGSRLPSIVHRGPIQKVKESWLIEQDKTGIACAGIAKTKQKEDNFVYFKYTKHPFERGAFDHAYIDTIDTQEHLMSFKPYKWSPTQTPVPTPTPAPRHYLLELDDFTFSGDRWTEDRSRGNCQPGPCFVSGNLSPGAFSKLKIGLLHSTDSNHNPKTTGSTISFGVKTSISTCCDHLKFIADNKLLGEWSGVNGWHYVEYKVPIKRPLLLEWAYIRSNEIESGATYQVWIKDIWIR